MMKAMLPALLVISNLFVFPGDSKAVTLGFDDLTTETIAEVTNGYGTLDWDGFDTVSKDHASGVFSHGVVSTNYVAANVGGEMATISHPAMTFNFKSVYMTAGWQNGLVIVARGYAGERRVYEMTNTISKSDGAVKFDFDWDDIDRLEFFSPEGTSNKDILFDEFTFSSIHMSIYKAVEIGWNSFSGVIYQVQYSTNYTSTNWFDLGTQIAGNGTTNFVFDSIRETDTRFYRVIEK